MLTSLSISVATPETAEEIKRELHTQSVYKTQPLEDQPQEAQQSPNEYLLTVRDFKHVAERHLSKPRRISHDHGPRSERRMSLAFHSGSLERFFPSQGAPAAFREHTTGLPPQDWLREQSQITKRLRTSQVFGKTPLTAPVVESEFRPYDDLGVSGWDSGGTASAYTDLTGTEAPADAVEKSKATPRLETDQTTGSDNEGQAPLGEKEATLGQDIGATGSVNRKGRKMVKNNAKKKDAKVGTYQQQEHQEVQPDASKAQQGHHGSVESSKPTDKRQIAREDNVARSILNAAIAPAAKGQSKGQSPQAAAANLSGTSNGSDDQQWGHSSAESEQHNAVQQGPAAEAPKPVSVDKGPPTPATSSIAERFFPTFPKDYRWPPRVAQGTASGQAIDSPRMKQTENIPPTHKARKVVDTLKTGRLQKTEVGERPPMC